LLGETTTAFPRNGVLLYEDLFTSRHDMMNVVNSSSSSSSLNL